VFDFRALNPSRLGVLATRREHSFFLEDYSSRAVDMEEMLNGARVLLIGGAGSIGGAVARLLVGFQTSALHIVDSNENDLVELTRDMRASSRPIKSADLRWIPLDFGGATMKRFLNSERQYDFVLNFAAIKHVRSEKDVSAVLRMLDTNVVKQKDLLGWLGESGTGTAYFSVSTDKAANPVNVMGASKRLMEHVMFTHPGSPRTSARFANVAFSNGSLLHGWINRVTRGQPIAAPRETRRFFVSIEESGQLCMLAALCQSDQMTLIPRLTKETNLLLLEEVAAAFLESLGLDAAVYYDEEEALLSVSNDMKRKRYPLLLTDLDTTGEKPFEEFIGVGEEVIACGFNALDCIPYVPAPADVGQLVAVIREYVNSPELAVSKRDLVELIRGLVPEFSHTETGRNLDQRV
jgi:FlaA1/EpsC-like NDP-sugar epimerase